MTCPHCQRPVEGRYCSHCGARTSAQASEKTLNIVCGCMYFMGFVAAIFLFIKPYNENPKSRFHAFQVLILAALSLFGQAANTVLLLVVPEDLQTSVRYGLTVLGIPIAIAIVVALVQAFRGRPCAIPVISKAATILAEQRAEA